MCSCSPNFIVWPTRVYLEVLVLIPPLNQFSEMLEDIKIYGFDSFEGLKEDMVGGFPDNPRGRFDRNKQPPRLNNNCVPVVGWIQDTLPMFISETPDLKINFVHIDTDEGNACNLDQATHVELLRQADDDCACHG